MISFVTRIKGNAGKVTTVAALALAVIGLAAPTSSASNESTWQMGCRGYWYSTSGHGYCSDANTFISSTWYTNYDCSAAIDTQHHDRLSNGYTGKYDTYECMYSINKTQVWQ